MKDGRADHQGSGNAVFQKVKVSPMLAVVAWRPGVLPMGLASHSVAPEPVKTIRLDAQELKWITEHPRVIVASLEYPLYLFKDEHGHWRA
jgi:two-component system sensor histidine kinase EvgS